jgi:hypothetical protein
MYQELDHRAWQEDTDISLVFFVLAFLADVISAIYDGFF